jgi:hypothetical protein
VAGIPGLLGGVIEDAHRRPGEPVADLLHIARQGVHLFDASLAHDLTAASDHLWATLADPGQFASLAKS